VNKMVKQKINGWNFLALHELYASTLDCVNNNVLLDYDIDLI